jgi:multidrug efflux pump subunit AcrA (membrane-fusion protein)
MTGIVTKIYPTEGEAISPSQKLFDIRLTHEELVQSQADLLRTTEELDVIGREIERIEKLATEGGLAGKTLLERKYEQQKQQAVLRSQRQALVLHGLSAEQIDNILQTRKLLQFLSVDAPGPTEAMTTAGDLHFFQVQHLAIVQGQHVNAGDSLAELVDHTELFIEGSAFERDVAAVSRVASSEKNISALLENEEGPPQTIPDLKILYAAPQIDPDSRTLHFYVTLSNAVEQNRKLPDGRRYIAWRFRPGQRVQLQIPVETWQDRIVLPVDAVVEEGAEAYVFVPNGDHFDRRTVHIEYKDPNAIVIANDGVLFPGDLIAFSAAKQLHLALKNKSGATLDPHAGHNH